MKGFGRDILCMVFSAVAIWSCALPANSDVDVINDGNINVTDIRDAHSEVGLNNDAGQSPGADFPDAEVLIRVITPSGSGYADSMNSTVSVAGIVFGKVKTIYIVGPDGQKQILSLDHAPYWVSDGINLVPGDNEIEVHAEGNKQKAMDKIRITYNPGVLFGSAPIMRPPAMFAGEKTVIHATMQAPSSTLIDRSTMRLVRCDAMGKIIKEEGQMLDDGMAQISGDEIQGDNVYTIQFDDQCNDVGIRYYRLAVDVRAFGGQPAYTAYSTPAIVECVNHLTAGVCRQHQDLLTSAQKAYTDARARGLSPADAKVAAYDVLQKDNGVTEHGDPASPLGIWVRFNDGVLGTVRMSEHGVRGADNTKTGNQTKIVSALDLGQRILSNRVLAWSPINSELHDTGILDESKVMADMLKNKECPAFNLDGPWTNGSAKLSFLRKFANYGIIALVTHGNAMFHSMSARAESDYGWFHQGSQEVLWSGQQVNCGQMLNKMTICTGDAQCPLGSQCLITSVTIEGKGNRQKTVKHGVCYDATQIDLMRGRVIMGPKNYAITPGFIDFYGQSGHAMSLVYLGACRSMYNGTLAAACMASGAQTVLGYNGYVTNRFASVTGQNLFQSLFQSENRVGVAAAQGTSDPSFHSRLMLFGSHWLDFTDYSILNGNFESVSMLGWNRNGDAREIPRLGSTRPAEGKRMAIISTGLGFTTDSGGITQKFCLPPGTTRVSFYWKFYSEEFKEFCNSPFNDSFQATISSPRAGERKLVAVNIDDLCPKGIKACDQGGSGNSSGCEPCTDCGDYWGDDQDHLIKSDVRFDRGGVWNTPWQITTLDLSGSRFSNQSTPVPVTLSFNAGDTGDSIYDTAILLDAIKIE